MHTKHKSSTVIELKINAINKSIEFLYTNNEHMDTEIKNTVPVIIIQYIKN